ncbi:unnamed protein product [Lactuca saligna]|uniref:RRM domain-containing protein n=1 Tax=Lactuca saligna TaxID=75948 RepID=A0AA35ZF62_LACSI|nr:unnamed protein product [Lactuca saligna]
MDSDQGKLFIGGISWETSEEKLKEYFGNYGEILQTVVMRDKISGRPRGFGFVVFSDPSVLDTVLQEKHTIDGRTVEAKRALSREEQQVSKAGNPSGGRSFGGGGGGGGGTRTKKIFVGGLPPTLSEEGFRQYFEAYGQVTDVVVMYDQQTNRPRGFGFISFDSEDAVDRVLHKTFHDLNGKQVEVKRALPKDANPGGGGGGRSMGGGGGGGSYGASGGHTGSYESRMDSNRYMQSQSGGGGGGGGGFPPYGTPGYGYGPSNGMGYNGYGSYGGGTPGYGGAPYGNPNVAGAGYGSAPSGAARSSWNAQPSSGYGGAGAYGAAPWGGSVAGGGGSQAAPPPTGQSPSGGAGYGSQGYGYGGGYGGGNDGSYGNPAGYGAVGGRIGGAPAANSGGAGGDIQSSGGGGGYMGSGGYGDANGYGNSGWRGDPSQASAGNYGVQGNGGQGGGGGGYGGYGGGPVRQVVMWQFRRHLAVRRDALLTCTIKMELETTLMLKVCLVAHSLLITWMQLFSSLALWTDGGA